jgi:hypothetical protein
MATLHEFYKQMKDLFVEFETEHNSTTKVELL